MSQVFWKSLLAAPAVLGYALVASNAAIANEVSAQTSLTEVQSVAELAQATPATSLDQVTSVSQLSDVQPTDWAFQALQSLVERYGCIAGYPDGTYRGNRAMTRYEFAAGLNACLDRVNELIAAGTADLATREDLATLQRLQEEFAAELATLRGRVDSLEARTAELEANQFSTTTKLAGEAIFSLAAPFGDDKAVQRGEAAGADGDLDDNIVFEDRVRLTLNTSFNGRDLLRTRLEAGNASNFADATGTESARRGYEADNGNDIELNRLWYRFPLGDKTRVFVAPVGAINDFVNVNNPTFESSGTGALNRFFRRNPAVYRLEEEQIVGANINFSDNIGIDVAYMTGDGESPAQEQGFIGDGNYSALAQLNFGLGQNLDLALTYARSYYAGGDGDDPETFANLSGSTGSDIAKRPFGQVATTADRFGASVNYKLGNKVSIGGWGGLVLAEAQSGPQEGDSADVWNWAVNLGLLDLGKEGSVLGFMFGMPPKAYVDGNNNDDPDTSYVAELQYRFPVGENVVITPGAYVVFNPNHVNDNDDVWVGVLRTTFKF